jgi:hypothetical protein
MSKPVLPVRLVRLILYSSPRDKPFHHESGRSDPLPRSLHYAPYVFAPLAFGQWCRCARVGCRPGFDHRDRALCRTGAPRAAPRAKPRCASRGPRPRACARCDGSRGAAHACVSASRRDRARSGRLPRWAFAVDFLRATPICSLSTQPDASSAPGNTDPQNVRVSALALPLIERELRAGRLSRARSCCSVVDARR